MPVSTKASQDAGIQLPPQTDPSPVKKGVLIKQKTDDELDRELNDTDIISNLEVPEGVTKPTTQIDAFLIKHQEDKTANYDAMARVLHLETYEVRERLKELGYSFPGGAWWDASVRASGTKSPAIDK